MSKEFVMPRVLVAAILAAAVIVLGSVVPRPSLIDRLDGRAHFSISISMSF